MFAQGNCVSSTAWLLSETGFCSIVLCFQMQLCFCVVSPPISSLVLSIYSSSSVCSVSIEPSTVKLLRRCSNQLSAEMRSCISLAGGDGCNITAALGVTPCALLPGYAY